MIRQEFIITGNNRVDLRWDHILPRTVGRVVDRVPINPEVWQPPDLILARRDDFETLPDDQLRERILDVIDNIQMERV